MFGVLDAANGALNSSRPKTLADRACDQCKQKKVRCSSGNPCLRCTSKGQSCTYDLARKKRGPPSKRLIMQHVRQRSYTADTMSPIADQDMSEAERDYAALPSATKTSPSSGQTSEHQSGWDRSITVDGFDTSTPGSLNRIMSSDGHEVPTPSSAVPAMFTHRKEVVTSPDAYCFPSLPVESPSSAADPFAGLIDQDLPPLPTTDIWPSKVNETTLLPWIDVYFKRLHPTIPILSRPTLYCDMLMRKHRTDPQYGAMLLGLSAFAMTQPVQIHERSSMPSRAVQARMLMEECVRMRVDASFGENPTIEMVLASFFLFACLFGSNEHRAARHRLREAVDLAHSLGLHMPDSYLGLETEIRDQWLRTYLVLSVTERAYALQQNHPINFRGRPGITARFMHAFGPNTTNEYLSSLIYQDRSDSVSMTGLLYLMDTFDAIDESVMDCWNGHCSLSDGVCETFDRRRALHMFRAQRRVREDCISGNISFAPSVTPTPLSTLEMTQRADISITQYWLLNRLWQLSLTHHLLRDTSDHAELQYDFACCIARATLEECGRLTLSAMEVHGIGFAEKLCDVTLGIVTALTSSSRLEMSTLVPSIDEEIKGHWHQQTSNLSIHDLLTKLRALLSDFRGGDHQHVQRLDNSLILLPGFQS